MPMADEEAISRIEEASDLIKDARKEGERAGYNKGIITVLKLIKEDRLMSSKKFTRLCDMFAVNLEKILDVPIGETIKISAKEI